MSSPTSPSAQTPALSAEQLTTALSMWATAENNAAMTAYQQGLATAAKNGVPPPTAPLLYDVNAALILQIETQEAAAPGSTPASQWALVVTQVPSPPANAAPTLPAESLTPIGSGVWSVRVNSGFGPSNGQPFIVNGVSYTAIWAGPFGPVDAVLTPQGAV